MPTILQKHMKPLKRKLHPGLSARGSDKKSISMRKLEVRACPYPDNASEQFESVSFDDTQGESDHGAYAWVRRVKRRV